MRSRARRTRLSPAVHRAPRAAIAPSFSAVTPVMVNSSSPVRPSDSARLAVGVLQRQHAHADQVRAVDPLVGLGDDGPDAEQRRALGRPVARRAGAVLLAGQDDQRGARPRRSAARRRRSTSTSPPAVKSPGDAALGAGRQLVAQPDVGERAADHHLVVAAAGAVGVEVPALDAVLGAGSCRPASRP